MNADELRNEPPCFARLVIRGVGTVTVKVAGRRRGPLGLATENKVLELQILLASLDSGRCRPRTSPCDLLQVNSCNV